MENHRRDLVFFITPGAMPKRTVDAMPTQDSTTEDPNAQQQNTGGQQSTTQQADATPATFEAWIETQPEEIKTLVNTRFSTLESTVKATRTERDGMAKQIKDLAKTQAEGSDARKALDEMGVKLEQTERRADFLEEAIKPEVQCRNPRAAWIVAQAENAFDKQGRPDWAAIKAEAPELFGVAVGDANAGANTEKKQKAQPQSMNNFIRAAAGRS